MERVLGSARGRLFGVCSDRRVVRTQTENAYGCPQSFYKVLGKEVSSKIDWTVKKSGNVAGMKFTKGGVVPDDDAVAALELAIDEVIEKKKVNEKDARRMRGILQYAASAFEWDVSDLTWWSRTTAPIIASHKGSVFNWTNECS